MVETHILTAKRADGGLSWDEGSGSYVCQGAGRQRAKILLTVDLLASYADHWMATTKERLLREIEGWRGGLEQKLKDPSVSGSLAKDKRTEVGKEILDLEGKIRSIDSFDLDKYLYELTRATLLADNEFGQLTYLVKRRISERKTRKEQAVLLTNWKLTGKEPSTVERDILALKVSPRSADLLSGVWQSRGEASGLDHDAFLSSRMVPLVWLLDWIQHIDALEIEIGQSLASSSRKMTGWDQALEPNLSAFNREMLGKACTLRGLMDSMEVESTAEKERCVLTLKEDFISSFLPSFNDYIRWKGRVDRIGSTNKAGIVVVGMGGSGKTTFLRRCYEVIRDSFGNGQLKEEIDPKSTAFVVGHLYKDIEVPVYGGIKKGMSLCWMDTAGSEDYRVLGQQMTTSIREMSKKIFVGEAVDYSLIFVWSYESGYNPGRDLKNFENVFSRFMGEVENLGYFGYQLPNRVYLMLNKVDLAVKDGSADMFKDEHERAFSSIMEKNPMNLAGENLGFVSVLTTPEERIADLLLVAISGISNADRKAAMAGLRNGINQSIIGNLLTPEQASDFKREVYDNFSGKEQGAYLQASIDWIERYLAATGGQDTTAKALLNSLRAFLIGAVPYA